ncbi:gamma carbonic anhydrase family protein [Rhodococcoides kyotonense]|uniref:Carbonic anhydrase or acetyltransferase, isoleucine patch superfamily n=1 Tax=Rhodococcoides kyotonense TaxID=398843 RepID=A0A239FHU5_9NOCA|nr:gamma carbonic anhydrase family protein [Rhodococcus kyotonensis]SNS55634.1 Carbonic anhydrase or acetyltransferase, isoleucine patch superfamily [Rhodococcus kyotonensis]
MTEQPTAQGPLWALDAGGPTVDPDAWVAPTATVVGRVNIAASSGIWYGAVLRAEFEDITIDEGSNLQDGVAAHVDPGFPLKVGKNVSVGHNAVLHGCTIGDGSLVGMGAVVMNGAVIGEGSLVAAGALVLEGTQVPPRSLVAGVPAKVRRELTEDEVNHNGLNAAVYRELLKQHRSARPA